MNLVKKIVLVLAIVVGNYSSAQFYSDLFEFGGSGMYNFQTNGLGVGGRAHLNMGNNFFLSPQYNKYFGFNKIKEYYFGLGFNYNVIPHMKWGVYPTVNVLYNNWQNSENFYLPIASKHNFAIEPGVGVIRNNSCMKPFAEARYDTKWKEFNFRAGIMFNMFTCKYGGNAGCGAYR